MTWAITLSRRPRWWLDGIQHMIICLLLTFTTGFFFFLVLDLVLQLGLVYSILLFPPLLKNHSSSHVVFNPFLLFHIGLPSSLSLLHYHLLWSEDWSGFCLGSKGLMPYDHSPLWVLAQAWQAGPAPICQPESSPGLVGPGWGGLVWPWQHWSRWMWAISLLCPMEKEPLGDPLCNNDLLDDMIYV